MPLRKPLTLTLTLILTFFPVNMAHANQILFEVAVSGFFNWCSGFGEFCFLFSSRMRWTYENDI